MSGVHIIYIHILPENKSQSFAFSVLSNNLDLTFISVENRPVSKDYHFAYFELIILKVELSQCESRNLFNLDYYPIWWPDKEPVAGFCCAWYNPTTRVNNPGKKTCPRIVRNVSLLGLLSRQHPSGRGHLWRTEVMFVVPWYCRRTMDAHILLCIFAFGKEFRQHWLHRPQFWVQIYPGHRRRRVLFSQRKLFADLGSLPEA